MTCHYKHALPPGYVLKRNKVAAEKKDPALFEKELDERRNDLDK
jgi:hypothetical protein